ncbi:RNA polymerase ECF family sigma subunit [Actinomadura pelletieri DSM 43383]|uniref:RNA polymerase ECF family sigma subunit n=1 Tax=Actinomadura pelletieri DSM 43383 TaxID=1120940 RepID=A0A495QGR2_9ACTN|nr:sigma-70 family RNA polymerase sigma factor [Actinomadura pelletieri]RKS71039.1 RNA polymerase ECF family sigma subunit [Actinomadura pelletieri DSM 43383]
MGNERSARFEKLYEAHLGHVTGYVRRRTGDADDAADVIAETFLVAWRRLDDVPPGEEARFYLYGVARRTLANLHRGQRRHRDLTDRIGRNLARDLAATPLPEPIRPELGAAFRALPERDRELLGLTSWEGLDNGQIATVLGVSRNAVRIRLHRARRRFARELERRGAGHMIAGSTTEHSDRLAPDARVPSRRVGSA